MIRLIAAIDRERGIAKRNAIPWSIPEDEQFFTDETKKYGGHVLSGKRTFETYQGPLDGRHNYILTHQTDPVPGAELVHDLPAFLASFKDKDLWAAGGADVFHEVLKLGLGDELYLTHIDALFGCDRFFPPYESDFTESSKSEIREQNGFHFYYARYVRR